VVTGQRIIYSPDGKFLAACDNDQVKVYDPLSGELIKKASSNPSGT
jgi:hypothetical protein